MQSDCNRYAKVRGGRSSSAPLHKAAHKTSQGKSESEEYDTLGSDSDTEVGTSSRTESSNHLVDSHHSASAADARVHSTQFTLFYFLSATPLPPPLALSLSVSHPVYLSLPLFLFHSHTPTYTHTLALSFSFCQQSLPRFFFTRAKCHPLPLSSRLPSTLIGPSAMQLPKNDLKIICDGKESRMPRNLRETDCSASGSSVLLTTCTPRARESDESCMLSDC